MFWIQLVLYFEMLSSVGSIFKSFSIPSFLLWFNEVYSAVGLIKLISAVIVVSSFAFVVQHSPQHKIVGIAGAIETLLYLYVL
jgi:hypothetical protein